MTRTSRLRSSMAALHYISWRYLEITESYMLKRTHGQHFSLPFARCS